MKKKKRKYTVQCKYVFAHFDQICHFMGNKRNMPGKKCKFCANPAAVIILANFLQVRVLHLKFAKLWNYYCAARRINFVWCVYVLYGLFSSLIRDLKG